MKVLLHIRFLGTRYCGYQVQPNGVTIQQRLNEAAKALFGYDCDIIGCSRTDSGVHANEFCATVSKKGSPALETTIPLKKIPLAMAHLLPEDIAVFRAEAVSDEFHPRYDVVYKEYIYKICNFPIRDPFWQDRAWHCPLPLGEEAIVNMKKATELLKGTQDFASYMAANSKVQTTVRTIVDADVFKEGDIVTFRVSANGFLYHMVRILTGTLVDVGYGRLKAEDILSITAAKDRKMAGPTAPPHGLYLNRVFYGK